MAAGKTSRVTLESCKLTLGVDTPAAADDKGGSAIAVDDGATWEVTGPSTLSGLTVEKGGTLKGTVKVDGKEITPSAGRTYTEKIAVMPL